MKEAAEIPNVVNCCNREGLYEKLENLQERYVLYFSLSWAFELVTSLSMVLMTDDPGK